MGAVLVAMLATAHPAQARCHVVTYKVKAKHWVYVRKTERVHGHLVVVRRHGKSVYVRKLESYWRTAHREQCTAPDYRTVTTLKVVREECSEPQTPVVSPTSSLRSHYCFYTITPTVTGLANGALAGAQVELSVLTADVNGETSTDTNGLPSQHWRAVANGAPLRIEVAEEVRSYPGQGIVVRTCSGQTPEQPFAIEWPLACPEREPSAWLIYARSEPAIPFPWESSYSASATLKATP